MSTTIRSDPNISLTSNDILKLPKEEFVTIEEYNEFIHKMKKEIKSKISEMNKAKQVVYSQKVVVTKSMLNGSIDFRSAKLALYQIERLILQINQNISNFEQVDKSMIFLKEEISNKRQKEANINENNINKNNDELINKNDINLITKSELPDKESYEETTRHSKNDSNEESNTIKGSNHKKEKIKSNKVSGNNKMKTKPKLKLKKSYNKNTYNKFNPNLLVAYNRTIMKRHNVINIRSFTIQSFQSQVNNYEYMNPKGSGPFYCTYDLKFNNILLELI
ncbi:hypothetical protein H8356DRAFT_1422203 [Neocallimastix lanati (nom. inval.)]|nr:hypothetical protein H8356DRAFT_1422203 [Neocallimastix sp. JGI-2020a]